MKVKNKIQNFVSNHRDAIVYTGIAVTAIGAGCVTYRVVNNFNTMQNESRALRMLANHAHKTGDAAKFEWQFPDLDIPTVFAVTEVK